MILRNRLSTEELKEQLSIVDDMRIWRIAEALPQGDLRRRRFIPDED
jgi:hypothetical protein